MKLISLFFAHVHQIEVWESEFRLKTFTCVSTFSNCSKAGTCKYCNMYMYMYMYTAVGICMCMTINVYFMMMSLWITLCHTFTPHCVPLNLAGYCKTWTLDWTMEWTVDWTVDWTRDDQSIGLCTVYFVCRQSLRTWESGSGIHINNDWSMTGLCSNHCRLS